MSLQAQHVFSALTSRLWPGAITIVARAATCIPACVTANTGFVGVRVPAHPIANALLRAARVPIAAPSANRFGHVSPTKAAHVVADLGHTPIGILLGEGPLAAARSESEDAATNTPPCSVIHGDADDYQTGEVCAQPTQGGQFDATCVARVIPGGASYVFELPHSVSSGRNSALLPVIISQDHAATLAPPLQQHVAAEMLNCAIGIESTVVKLEELDPPSASLCRPSSASTDSGAVAVSSIRDRIPGVRAVILRRGGVSLRQLRDALDASGLHGVAIDYATTNNHAAIVAPSHSADSVSTLTGALATNGASSVPTTHATTPSAVASLAEPTSAAADAVGTEAPGMLLTHYSPDIDSVLVVSDCDATSSAPLALQSVPGLSSSSAQCEDDDAILSLGSTVVLDIAGLLAPLRRSALAYMDLSAKADISDACRGVFDGLRWAERVPGARRVLLCDPLMVPASQARASVQHAEALHDRLFRAASGKTLPLSRALSMRQPNPSLS